MKLLIVYGTTEGQTRKICQYLRDKAIENGHEVSMLESTGPNIDPGGFDAVLVGASLHAKKYQASIKYFLQRYHQILNKKPTAFVSVSLAAVHKEHEYRKELEEITEEFLNKTGWNPTFVEQVAGALRYTEYSFWKKFIMRMIAQKSGGSTDTSKDIEYTDWQQVEDLLDRLEKEVAGSKSKQSIGK